jgi:2-desacetyl-2-hydroxyethyl bacteriochlorophyllide A dehydrogenase
MQIQRLVFPDKGRCEVEEVQLDENLKDGEVLLKTKISLISAGTELSMFTRAHRGFDEPDFGYAKYPFRPGYLAVSDVVASKSSEVKIGDRLFSSGGHATYSKEKFTAGSQILVPKDMNPEHATFFGLARIAMTAPRLSPVRLGGNVVVIGMGIVGNLCGQLYLHSGAGAVGGADLSERRLRTARECGLTHAFNTGARPLAEWVKDFGPRGAEWIIEAVGNSKTIDAAFKAISFKGNVVLLGSPRTRMEIDPYFDIHRKGIAVIGAHGMHVDAKTQTEDAPLLMEWLRSGKLKVAPMITQHMPFTDALKGFEGLRDKTDEFVGVILTY